MKSFTKVIEVTLPHEDRYKCFKQDGCKVYCVRINAIGIDHDIWMTVPGDNPDDAADIAARSLSEIQWGDFDILETIEVED